MTLDPVGKEYQKGMQVENKPHEARLRKATPSLPHTSSKLCPRPEGWRGRKSNTLKKKSSQTRKKRKIPGAFASVFRYARLESHPSPFKKVAIQTPA